MESAWVAGHYPALRFNNRDQSSVNRTSDFWLINVKYLRARTIEVGYTLPEGLLNRIKVKKARVYANSYNLFSLDNVDHLGLDPEVMDTNGLQYPQNTFVNLGVNLSF